jgi:hypothetical protein
LIAAWLIWPPPHDWCAAVVQVGNVRAHGRCDRGNVPARQWLADNCAMSGSVPAHPGVTIEQPPGEWGVRRRVPPGDWGAQAFQDENGNHEIDRGFSAFPRKAWAFRAMPRS